MGSARPRAARHGPSRQHAHSCAGLRPAIVHYRKLISIWPTLIYCATFALSCPEGAWPSGNEHAVSSLHGVPY